MSAHKLFFHKLNSGYAELQADSKAWAEHLEERKQWDPTLADGMHADEQWTEDGQCLTPDDGNS
jgi:hypothetical protein